jgi:hypothetical protein
MRIAPIVPFLMGAMAMAACTPNNSDTESGASGEASSADLLPSASPTAVSSAAATTASAAPSPAAAASAAPPIRATPSPTQTPVAVSEAVFVARLRALPQAGATIDVLTAGKLAIVAGCLVLQTDEGPALAVFNPAARFDPATGTITQGVLRVTLGQPVTVTAVPRQASDFGFLTKEPPSSCPTRVISMASLQRR